MDTIPGTNISKPKPGNPIFEAYNKYTPEQYLLAAHRQKTLWYDRTNEAVVNAREKGTDEDTAMFEAVLQSMRELYGGDPNSETETNE